MTVPASSFFPVSDWQQARQDASNRSVIALGTPESQTYHQQAESLASQADSEAAIVIVPLGVAGEVLWNGVPKEIASIVAVVRPEALVFCRLSKLTSETDRTLWDIVSDPTTRVAVTPMIPLPFLNEGLPKLAPHSRSLSKVLAGKIDAIGDDSHHGIALRAGLALIHDDLDRSHEFAQSIEGVGLLHLGDCWHAIMHRREPDYSNSKYWFRRVGTHPVAAELSKFTNPILNNNSSQDSSWKRIAKNGNWGTMAFVDLCEQAARDEKSSLGIAARQIQWLEMLLLLRLCSQQLQ